MFAPLSTSHIPFTMAVNSLLLSLSLSLSIWDTEVKPFPPELPILRRWISTSVVSKFTIWRCWSSTSVWGVPALGKWGGLGKGELPASYPQDISVNCIYVLGKTGGYLYELWTILATKTGGYLLRHLSQTAFPAFPRGLTRSHQSCRYCILVYRT